MAKADAKPAKNSEDNTEPTLTDQVTAPAEETAMAVEAAEQEQAVIADKRSTTAKAGKRSAKALEEAEEKAAKEARKAARAEHEAEETEKPKQKQNPARPRLERQGKNFRKAAAQVDKTKAYSLRDALELAVKTSPVKFDATVEFHVNLGVDPRHADQNIRDNFVLPQGTGKTVRVAVFADVDDAAKAKAAGADLAGSDEVIKLLDKNALDFDILVATPSQMPKLGKYARVLGPRGLMPNPKSGTVTTDVSKAVKEAKAGRVEYRVDSTGIVHLGIGKVSFGADRLSENAQVALNSIRSNKPASVKSNYVRAIFVATSMGPSIKVETGAIG